MEIHKIEIQDHKTNIYYPHTDASIVGLQTYKIGTIRDISNRDTVVDAIGILEARVKKITADAEDSKILFANRFEMDNTVSTINKQLLELASQQEALLERIDMLERKLGKTL